MGGGAPIPAVRIARRDRLSWVVSRPSLSDGKRRGCADWRAKGREIDLGQ